MRADTNDSNTNSTFEKVLKKVQEENFNIKFLKQVFDESANLLDYSAHTLHLSLDNYLKAPPRETDNLRNVVNKFTNELSSMIKDIRNSYDSIRTKVLSPFKTFATDYQKNSNKFSNTINTVLSELNEVKDKVNRTKDEYFKASSKTEKAETTLQMTIKSIEKGNFSFNDMIKMRTGKLVNKAIDEMVTLKEQAKKQFEIYKKATEEANALMGKRELYYNSLIESMVQLSQSRTSIKKSYLQKFVIIIESFFKKSLARLNSLALAVESINDKEDYLALKESVTNNDEIFSLMKCTEYISE